MSAETPSAASLSWKGLRDRTRAVLFDFDGIVADTEPTHFKTFSTTLLENGVDIRSEADVTTYMGIHDRAAFQLAFERAGKSLSGDDCEAMIQRKSDLYASSLDGIPLYPGIRESIEGAAKRGPMTIASGGRRRDIRGVLSYHGLLDRFGPFISGDDITRSKPDPECFLLALDLLRQSGAADLRPEECLVFEDTFRGVESAKAAGMVCVAVTNSYPAQRLVEADLIVESLDECRW